MIRLSTLLLAPPAAAGLGWLFALLVLVGLHVAGALKHHLIDKDSTLRRMLPFGR